VLVVATYPIDVVKSRVQSDSFDAKTAQYKGAIDCTKYIWKTEGMRGFWKVCHVNVAVYRTAP
jgi:solute carrier family 25 carnitine/acylcarnitine transporter 20/29